MHKPKFSAATVLCTESPSSGLIGVLRLRWKYACTAPMHCGWMATTKASERCVGYGVFERVLFYQYLSNDGRFSKARCLQYWIFMFVIWHSTVSEVYFGARLPPNVLHSPPAPADWATDARQPSTEIPLEYCVVGSRVMGAVNPLIYSV